MDTQGGGEPASDAELVRASVDGDRDSFAALYDRYSDGVYDFCTSVLRDRDDAADAMQDTFLIAAVRLNQLRDPDRVKAWLYSIARNESLRRARARARVAPESAVTEVADTSTSPEEAAQQGALQKLVWDAAAGLSDRDRSLLDLHLRQGLEGADLGQALGTSAEHAYVLLNRLRTRVERTLGAFLVARLGRDDCNELAALLSTWDGRFSPLIRKRVARHVDGCAVCSDRRRALASPSALLAMVPLVAAPLELREVVLTSARLPSERGPSDKSARGRWWGAAALVALFIVAGVVLTQLGSGSPEEPAEAVIRSPSTTPTAPRETPDEKLTEDAGAQTSDGDAGPPRLEVASTVLDLGSDMPGGALRMTNRGGGELVWNASTAAPWIGLSASMPIASGESVPLRISAARNALNEGDHRTVVAVSSNGGSAEITVTMSVERAPEIGSVTITPPTLAAGSCGPSRASVRAEVTDESGIASVGLDVSGSRSPMAPRGSAYFGALGPYNAPGTLTLRVVATDTRGNSSEEVSHSVAIVPCASEETPRNPREKR
jgi:RNA polymerase sigma factor (sigma-70 family)